MSMTLKDRIPKEFYSLFRTKNMDAYMQIVVALYEENNEVYASLGLTREECQIIIADTISKQALYGRLIIMKMRVIKIVAAWIIMMIIILIPKLMLYMTRPVSHTP